MYEITSVIYAMRMSQYFESSQPGLPPQNLPIVHIVLIPHGSYNSWNNIALKREVYTILPPTVIQKQLMLNDWILSPVGNTIFYNVRDNDMLKIFPIIKANYKSLRHFGVVHIGDEKNTENKFWYNDLSLDFIIRNYYFSPLKKTQKKLNSLGNLSCSSINHKSNIFYLPQIGNGEYMHGFTPSKQSSLRNKTCAWIGSLRANRKQMVDFFGATNFCDINVQDTFRGNIHGTQYYEFLQNTKFILNPKCQNSETIRWGEIMMSGAIPVSIDESPFYHALFKPVPGIYAKDWIIAHVTMQNMKHTDTLQHQCIQFYKDLIHCIQLDLSVLLHKWIH